MKEEKVIYCEWLGLGNPIEKELTKEEAIRKYNSKIEALKGFLFKDTSFIGVKDKTGRWLIKNN